MKWGTQNQWLAESERLENDLYLITANGFLRTQANIYTMMCKSFFSKCRKTFSEVGLNYVCMQGCLGKGPQLVIFRLFFFK